MVSLMLNIRALHVSWGKMQGRFFTQEGFYTNEKRTVTTNQITEGVIWKQLLYSFFPILFGTFFSAALQHGGRRHRGAVRWHAGAGRRGRRYGLSHQPLRQPVRRACLRHDSGHRAGVRCARRRERRRYGAYLGGAGSGRGAWSYSSRRGGRALGAERHGHPGDIMDFALIYLRVYMLGTIPSFCYNVGSGILRAVATPAARCTSSSSRAW